MDKRSPRCRSSARTQEFRPLRLARCEPGPHGKVFRPPIRYHGPTRRSERGEAMAYLEGQLRRNVDEAENEHTGYVLEVEVDMSAVQNTEELVNGQVAVTGDIEFVDYPEQGKVLVFRVSSAAVVEEEIEETD